MKRKPVHIIHTTCRRCGSPLCTLSRSLVGADDLKAEFGSICEVCTSPEEAADLDRRLDERMAKAFAQRRTR